MIKITKAVFPVAGLGTRFLPATKAMPKELLPIIDKPLIQYAAEEAIAAGIDTLIFVTGRNKRAIEDHFDSNFELETVLRKKGNTKQAEMIRNIIPKGVECIFVRQPEQLGLGHAILCAERVVGKSPFAVLLADDFLVPNGIGVTGELIENYRRTNKSQLSVMKIEGPELSQYGVVKLKNKDGIVKEIVEKPTFKEAPSNLASIGRYVLSHDIFRCLRKIKMGTGNELQLTDAINVIAKINMVSALKINHLRFDCGSVEGYLEAIKYMAGRRT